MEKRESRDKYKRKREKLTTEQIQDYSLAIANQVLNLDIWGFTYYHVFLSISEKKEVNTEYLLHILQGKDKSIVVPKTNFEEGSMSHILLQENTVLKHSDYKVPEPVSGIEISADKMEVVFVPLMVYDLEGHRIGYGKGFYDRFLAECADNAIFIGLSFFDAEDKIAYEEKDIPLDYCVTPRKIYSF